MDIYEMNGLGLAREVQKINHQVYMARNSHNLSETEVSDLIEKRIRLEKMINLDGFKFSIPLKGLIKRLVSKLIKLVKFDVNSSHTNPA